MLEQKKRSALIAALLGTVAAIGAGNAWGIDRPVGARVGTIDPFAGDIEERWGTIRPFWGDIDEFWGTIRPFDGNINSFWGTIRPFDGPLGEQWRQVGGFWEDAGPVWDASRVSWQAGNYTDAAAHLQDLITRSSAFWGSSVQAATGLSFEQGFSTPLLERYGIELDDPNSLAGLSPADQSQFMMEWYDGLMAYSGTDAIDWWMSSVRWTPAITQQQGSGERAKIGLLDFFAGGNHDVRNRLVWFDGVSTFSNGHGAAVASLMVSAHDGQGVMGIAPEASVIGYGPFDETGTASWADVTRGVGYLKRQGASVINMSLGVAGWTLHPDWKGVFSDQFVRTSNLSTVFVMAAGNDGVMQSQNIEWDWSVDPNIIVVGSIGPDGEISDFSNTPGNTCMLKKGKCKETYRLRDRFIVAPGELMLVAGDNGELVRRSGTSFAAPLVSGAIALLHDRWP